MLDKYLINSFETNLRNYPEREKLISNETKSSCEEAQAAVFVLVWVSVWLKEETTDFILEREPNLL